MKNLSKFSQTQNNSPTSQKDKPTIPKPQYTQLLFLTQQTSTQITLQVTYFMFLIRVFSSPHVGGPPPPPVPKPPNPLQQCLFTRLQFFSLMGKEYPITSSTKQTLSFHIKENHFLPHQGKTFLPCQEILNQVILGIWTNF